MSKVAEILKTAGIEPYYYDAKGDIAVVCGDCREVLPRLPDGCVDLVLTDPPYGTGWARGGGRVGEFNAKHEKPEWDTWSTEWIVGWKRYAIFCPLSRACELKGTQLYYRKTNPRPSGPTREAIVVFPTPWKMQSWEFSAYNGDSPFHPCQKPTALMEWLVSGVSDIGDLVLDPFAGSGTTGRACKDLGRSCLMIELEERYCEISANRLRQEVLFT